MTQTEKTYFNMLTVYHKVVESGTTKQLSKVLRALEDFERRYYNAHGFGALMSLMFKAEEQNLYVH